MLRTNYYVVTGGTSAELHASILRGRPQKDGIAYDAKTTWNTSYTLKYRRTNAGFEPTTFAVKTVVVVTLPLWQPPKERPPELAMSWWPYVRALTTHEQGHVSLAREAAAEAGRRLGGLGAFPSAEALTQAAQQAVTAALEEGRAKERRYDEETRHGATQGAVFHFTGLSPRTPDPSPPNLPTQN
jgi:predicted secreted Zn-dependent protease